MPSQQELSQTYNVRAATGLAIAQLILGSLLLVGGIVVFVLYTGLWAYAFGALELWGPLFPIIAGVLGIIAARECSPGLIVTHLALSTVAAMVSLALFGISIRTVVIPVYGPHIAVLLFAFPAALVAIASAAFCGHALSGGSSSRSLNI